MQKNNQRQTPVLRVLCVVTAAVMLAACLSGCCGMLSKDGVMRLNTAAVSPDRALTAAPKAYTTLYCTADDFVSLRGKPDAGGTTSVYGFNAVDTGRGSDQGKLRGRGLAADVY